MGRREHPAHKIQREVQSSKGALIDRSCSIINFDAVFTFENMIIPAYLTMMIDDRIYYTAFNFPGTIPILDSGFFVFDTKAFRETVDLEYREERCAERDDEVDEAVIVE